MADSTILAASAGHGTVGLCACTYLYVVRLDTITAFLRSQGYTSGHDVANSLRKSKCFFNKHFRFLRRSSIHTRNVGNRLLWTQPQSAKIVELDQEGSATAP